MHAPTIGPLPRQNPNEAWWSGLPARDDRAATALLQTEIQGGRHQRSVYELFAEMEEKDGHLYAVIQTRLNGLLGLSRRLVPAPPADEPALRAQARVQELLDRIPRLEEMLRALLDGIAKGFAVVELVWGYDAAGALVVVDWIAHPQESFAFDAVGGLLLLSPPFRAGSSPAAAPGIAPARTAVPAVDAFPPPGRKFIVLRFGADFRNPYGRGLSLHAYWYYWFKKNALKFWAVYNEKYGSPTALARYGPGTSEEERRRLIEMLQALQTDTGIVVPETVDLRFLEQRAGSGDSYRDFLDWCNDEMAKIVLGATLTSGEGRRSGSLALGGIHQLVRQDYIEADARLLERTLNDTLLRWLAELNLGPTARPPRLYIETDSAGDLSERIKVDQALLSIGVSLPQSYFYQRYGRPAPATGDQALRYDDANFYGYHLQYGVLTTNEVRARLNLPPVPWGDTRTSPVENRRPGLLESGEDTGRKPV